MESRIKCGKGGLMHSGIEVGNIVNVSLKGTRPTSLERYEVLQIPGNVQDYWEFEGPTGDVVAVRDPIVTKPPT